MDLTKDIPARTAVTHSVSLITFNIDTLKAYVKVSIPGEDEKTKEVDVAPIFDAYNTEYKGVIDNLFKDIISQSMGTIMDDVPEVFTAAVQKIALQAEEFRKV